MKYWIAFLAGILLQAGCVGFTYGQPVDTAAQQIAEIRNKLATAGNDSAKAYWQLDLGRKLLARKAYDEAIALLRQSLAYQERVKDIKAIAKVKTNIAQGYNMKLDTKNALVYLEEAVAAAEKSGDKQLLSMGFANLITTYNRAGLTAKGLDNAQKLLRLGQKENDPKMIGTAYYYTGYFYHLNGNMGMAMQQYDAALRQYEAARDTSMIASLQINIGEYYSTSGQPDSAKVYYNRSLQTYTRLNDKAKLAALYMRLGNLYAAGDDTKNILALSSKSLSLARELNDTELMAFYGFSVERIRCAELFRSVSLVDDKPVLNTEQRKILVDAIGKMETYAQDYRKATVNYVELSRMLQTMSYVRQAMGDYEGALNDYRAYIDYKDSFASADNLKQFVAVEAKYAFEKSRDSLRLKEEQRRIELEKEMELNALRFEYEKKRALAKTEVERKELLFEEELKRKAIEAEYTRSREVAQTKYEQGIALAKANEEKERALSLARLRKSRNTRNMSLLGAGVLLVLAGIAGYGYSQKRRDNRKIADEKKRSDDLLLNILPAEVAEELKANGHSVAQQYNNATVLFTDFVSFTQVSERLGVQDLVNELNIYFTAFDRIMEKYGLEKIKTIGDAYLAVSGLPVEKEAHAENAVKAALDIIAFVKQRKQAVAHGLDIRIGINSGSLIAGIIGVKKFAYDIWGDTVNTAARMEQSGEPGRVNISESTYELVRKDFTCTYRGKIDAKNKGDMDMYFVEGIIHSNN
ncbi:adenylate/guanylate cyclase domain-containing protein [Taibaiella koreensis]|uniref:adenylate/guanylate cyclase domain-containing protein n=1 Tax=Taibaiella koreensis TaxID=1268548 RepID=UPI0013C35004|nr:adenylate/guanylate cyclase domain-containing protein [Taibaiella koreensis]